MYEFSFHLTTACVSVYICPYISAVVMHMPAIVMKMAKNTRSKIWSRFLMSCRRNTSFLNRKKVSQDKRYHLLSWNWNWTMCVHVCVTLCVSWNWTMCVHVCVCHGTGLCVYMYVCSERYM